MKRIVFLLTIFFALAGVINAQQVRISPFEGRWVWDGRGEDEPDFIELVFFGNIMLGTDDKDDPAYEGASFTYTNRTINIRNGYDEWEYSLSGNTLTITDEYDDRYTYNKAAMGKSTLEGIWKVTEGSAGFTPKDEFYFVFTGDLMAAGEDGDYDGYKVEFRGSKIYPSQIYLKKDLSENDLSRMAIGYKISGKSLTLTDPDGDEIKLTKVY